MGIQQTYLLITDSGKQIRTTSEHPYLVREDSAFGRGLFVESNIDQKSNNHHQGESYNHLNVDIDKINHNFNPFLNLIAESKQIIPSIALKVNNPNLINMVVLEKGTPKATINQPADKLTSNSDSVMTTTESGLLFTSTTLSDSQLAVNQGEKWIKVKDLKPGIELATLDGWEKIVAIKEHAREQVYDIEVEGTHNFVGNDIVAHNTFVVTSLGNVGVGFTTPDRNLQIASDINITSSLASLIGVAGTQFSISGSSANNLQKKLVLGIDTTDNYSLIQSINAGSFANLSLNPAGGNVGIGTTNPSQVLQVNSSVLGQCVAAGTRIRRKRKGKRGQGEEDWEDVPVEDIKPDDEVLSLNDKTGEFEWHKVEVILDTGIQTVYRLETASGKWIETTSEHPYLVINVGDLLYGLDDVLKLHPVEFNWQGESDTTAKNLGFIAQEVEGIIPKLVLTSSDGLKELNTIGLVPILTRAIQQQQALINSLQSSVISLQTSDSTSR